MFFFTLAITPFLHLMLFLCLLLLFKCILLCCYFSLHCCFFVHIGVSLCTQLFFFTLVVPFRVWCSSSRYSSVATPLHVCYCFSFALSLLGFALHCNSLYYPHPSFLQVRSWQSTMKQSEIFSNKLFFHFICLFCLFFKKICFICKCFVSYLVVHRSKNHMTHNEIRAIWY
jgi:hypothetical protein